MSVSPQTEDGFTMIANELMEHVLGFRFSHRELAIIFTIFRKTYGYGKKEDDISASQIGEMCGIQRQHVTTTLNILFQKNVIFKKPGRYGCVIGIQKNYSLWITSDGLLSSLCSPKAGQVSHNRTICTSPIKGQVSQNNLNNSPKAGQVDSPTAGHTKENLPKENKQKKSPREEITFLRWLEKCKEDGIKPVPEDDPVFSYANQIGLPIDYVRYAWLEFKRGYSQGQKKYKNWNQHFQKCVRANWYGIWYEKDGGWLLTTAGKQLKKEHSGE